MHEGTEFIGEDCHGVVLHSAEIGLDEGAFGFHQRIDKGRGGHGGGRDSILRDFGEVSFHRADGSSLTNPRMTYDSDVDIGVDWGRGSQPDLLLESCRDGGDG